MRLRRVEFDSFTLVVEVEPADLCVDGWSCWLAHFSILFTNIFTLRSNKDTSVIAISLFFVYAQVTNEFHIADKDY